MKVLMFGWEFPPYKSGGLGTACYDLTKGLARQGIDVTFVMPSAPENAEADFVRLLGANNLGKNVKIRGIPSILSPYQTSETYMTARQKAEGTKGSCEVYGKDMYEEVYRYGEIAKTIAEDEEHDIIHAHDWMTYQAGINAKKASGKPLVVHIHATEFDRTGGNPNQFISHREYEGMHAADLVIANSKFTKDNVISHYGIPEDKIRVVYWGIESDKPAYSLDQRSPFNDEKLVLFLGRITIQKGPDYFIEAAKKVLDHEPDTKFHIVGEGDMKDRVINRVIELGMADNFIFSGWLKGDDVHRAFQMADLYVMPSVAEPFGLVALESLKNGTPLIISKTSGASEVLDHALKIDFWDVDEMANKIVCALKYPELYSELKDNSYAEVQRFNLDEPAKKTMDVYSEAIKEGTAW